MFLRNTQFNLPRIFERFTRNLLSSRLNFKIELLSKLHKIINLKISLKYLNITVLVQPIPTMNVRLIIYMYMYLMKAWRLEGKGSCTNYNSLNG